jgi:hypothetical protein
MAHDAARSGQAEEDGREALRELQRKDGVLSKNRRRARSPVRHDYRPGESPDCVEEGTVGR